MNAKAAEALYQAEREGVPQIFGKFSKGRGRCALGVLLGALGHETAQICRENRTTCPLCGKISLALIVHLNDDHRLTFSEIARKLGPDSV